MVIKSIINLILTTMVTLSTDDAILTVQTASPGLASLTETFSSDAVTIVSSASAGELAVHSVASEITCCKRWKMKSHIHFNILSNKTVIIDTKIFTGRRRTLSIY